MLGVIHFKLASGYEKSMLFGGLVLYKYMSMDLDIQLKRVAVVDRNDNMVN